MSNIKYARMTSVLCLTNMILVTSAYAEGAIDTITVTTKKLSKLNQNNDVGSTLGLTPFETPSTIDIITQEDMQNDGLRSLIEVYNSAPGVRSGDLPGEPGVTTMRGFSRGATGYLVDGVRAIDPLLVSRNYDSFNFDRVEVLKGPASVVNGTGALAGAINLVTRQVNLEQSSQEAMLSYGSFNAIRLGGALNQPIGEDTGINASVSYGQSDGFVDDTDSNKLGITAKILTKATEKLTLSASLDYFHDNFETAYFGTPLVDAAIARDASDIVSTANGMVIDKAMRNNNYNVSDGKMDSDTIWFRGQASYQITDTWKLDNEFSYYTADRLWSNAEDYVFNAGTNLLDRYTTLISHDHQFWSDRIMVANDDEIGGLRNRFSIGGEYVETDLASNRRFGDTTSVDPFNYARGTFPALTAANYSTRQDYESKVKTIAVFAEDAVNLAPKWLVTAGFRYEDIDLDRSIYNLNTDATSNFGQNYDSVSWRVGTVYEVSDKTALFAQYNKGQVPITSLLLSSSSRAVFDLSSGQSIEAGIKSSFWNDQAVVTVSIYHIDQDDILTRDPNTPSLTIQGGSQRSQGAEFDMSVNVTEQWNVSANASVQDVEFTSLFDGNGVSQAGNRPSNVPSHTFNISTKYTFEQLPLTVGASMRHSSSFYTDNANSIKVKGHTLLDASVSYPVGNGTLILQGRNLTNRFYADWSGYSPSQVYIGAPRSVDLTYNVSF